MRWLLLAFCVAFIVCCDSKDDVQKKFLPELAREADSISKIVISKQGKSQTIEYHNGQWSLPSRYYYPVQLAKVRGLVIGAVELEIIEKKTSNPDKLEILGLRDSNTEGAKSHKIQFFSGDRKIADFVVGSSRRSGGAYDNNAFYIRNSGDNQSWLVRGSLDVDLSADSILQKQVLSIDRHRIKSVKIKHKGWKKPLTIARKNPLEGEFALVGFDVKKIKSQELLKDIAYATSSMSFQDVRPLDGKRVDTLAPVLEFTTFDGLALSIKFVLLGKAKWFKISAIAEASASQDVIEEADKINSLAKEWIYSIDDVLAGKMLSKKKDLLN